MPDKKKDRMVLVKVSDNEIVQFAQAKSHSLLGNT